MAVQGSLRPPHVPRAFTLWNVQNLGNNVKSADRELHNFGTSYYFMIQGSGVHEQEPT